jgi:hypothetical protein
MSAGRLALIAVTAGGGIAVGVAIAFGIVWWASGPSRKESIRQRATRREHS